MNLCIFDISSWWLLTIDVPQWKEKCKWLLSPDPESQWLHHYSRCTMLGTHFCLRLYEWPAVAFVKCSSKRDTISWGFPNSRDNNSYGVAFNFPHPSESQRDQQFGLLMFNWNETTGKKCGTSNHVNNEWYMKSMNKSHRRIWNYHFGIWCAFRQREWRKKKWQPIGRDNTAEGIHFDEPKRWASVCRFFYDNWSIGLHCLHCVHTKMWCVGEEFSDSSAATATP